jgi:single-strand DNA-binding protein
MSVNRVILIGNVGKDPEVNYIREDVPVAKFPLATSETYTKNGERVTNTEWHNIVVWRGLAKVVENYVRKGSLLFIEGKISTRSYEKEGETKYFTEIVADNLRMLGKRTDEQDEERFNGEPGSAMHSDTAPDTGKVEEDDLPF